MNQVNAKSKPNKGKAKRRKKQDEIQDFEEPFEEGMVCTTMSEVRNYFGDVKWSWYHHIPNGHVTMFVGPQGVGKSYLMAYLIAVLTGSKKNWPDEQPYTGKTGKVLLVETEQMRGEYVTRMTNFKVKDDRVLFPIEEKDDPTYTVDLITDMNLVEASAKNNNCVAVIIDSLSGGHDLDEKSDNMRKILKILGTMAGRIQKPVIVAHHPRKKSYKESPRVTLDRVRGSSTITQFCRSVIGMYRLSEDQTSVVRVEVIKASFCKPPEPFGFEIDENGLIFCEAPKVAKSMTATDVASEFLMEILANGPVKIKTIRAQSEDEGITTYALYTAKNRLGVVTIKGSWKLRTIDGKPYPVSDKAMQKDGAR